MNHYKKKSALFLAALLGLTSTSLARAAELTPTAISTTEATSSAIGSSAATPAAIDSPEATSAAIGTSDATPGAIGTTDATSSAITPPAIDSAPKVVKLNCPTDYPFILFNNSSDARGITSETYYITNYGSNDIKIDLSNIRMEISDSVRELSAPIDSTYQSNTKDVFAFLKVLPADTNAATAPNTIPDPNTAPKINIPDQDETPKSGDFILTGAHKTTDYSIILKAANCDENGNFISYNPDSIFSFQLAGNITPNKELAWQPGDLSLKVSVKYTILTKQASLKTDADQANDSTDSTTTVDTAKPSVPEESSVAVKKDTNNEVPPKVDSNMEDAVKKETAETLKDTEKAKDKDTTNTDVSVLTDTAVNNDSTK